MEGENIKRLKEFAYLFMPLENITDFFTDEQIKEIENETQKSFAENYRKFFCDGKLNYYKLIFQKAIEGRPQAMKVLQGNIRKIERQLKTEG